MVVLTVLCGVAAELLPIFKPGAVLLCALSICCLVAVWHSVLAITSNLVKGDLLPSPNGADYKSPDQSEPKQFYDLPHWMY